MQPFVLELNEIQLIKNSRSTLAVICLRLMKLVGFLPGDRGNTDKSNYWRSV